MKRLALFFIAISTSVIVMAQTDTTIVEQGNVTIVEEPGQTTIKIGDKNALIITEKQDTTAIKFGGKGIIVVENEAGTKVDWIKEEEGESVSDSVCDSDGDWEEDEESDEDSSKSSKFKPHWAGLEIGLNNFVNSDFSMSLDPAADFMDLNTGRSWNFNLNFMEYGIGLGTDKVGLVTGLGLEWMNYHFDGNSNIMEDANGVVVEYIPAYVTAGANIEKTRLQTTYLTAPLLLEFQIPAGKKRVYLSGGVLGGVKLGSNTKIVYREGGDKQKEKRKDDYNLAALRYGFTVRAGYRNIKLFANYYPVSLFEKNKGPELYPFAIGLNLLTF